MSNEEHNHEHKQSYMSEYLKFSAVIVVILMFAFYFYTAFSGDGITDFIRYFMGLFFVVFASFKFWNLEEFPGIFATYDIVAKKYPKYGYVYPFIQIFLGLFYLADIGGAGRDLVTLIIGSVSAYGVIKAVYFNKEQLRCACLGNVIKLPLSTVSLVEDLGMAVMALIMLIF